jgi:DNA (cytosine-5)-methyltransferase 1
MGWKPSFFSEIEKFPRAVLGARYPEVSLHGDFTTIKGGDYEPIELLVGGTPCQSFSVAGLRKGMEDERGNLALEYLRLAKRLGPRWLVWENVPGILSSWSGDEPPSDLEEGQEWEATETSDFGCFLAGLEELGYGFAYRVLDAQYFGVPQRRRRVFVVAYFGDWRPPAAVLFERQSLCGNTTPSRETGSPVAALTANGVGTCGADDNQGQAGHLIATTGLNGGETARVLTSSNTATGRLDPNESTYVVHGTQDPCVSDKAFALGQNSGQENVIAFSGRNRGAEPKVNRPERPPHSMVEKVGALDSTKPWNVAQNMQVRRLTPVECERLQGFPDNYTRIPWRGKAPENCPDGPRYKALGNSFAVPVVKWLGERIQIVDELQLD